MLCTPKNPRVLLIIINHYPYFLWLHWGYSPFSGHTHICLQNPSLWSSILADLHVVRRPAIQRWTAPWWNHDSITWKLLKSQKSTIFPYFPYFFPMKSPRNPPFPGSAGRLGAAASLAASWSWSGDENVWGLRLGKMGRMEGQGARVC